MRIKILPDNDLAIHELKSLTKNVNVEAFPPPGRIPCPAFYGIWNLEIRFRSSVKG